MKREVGLWIDHRKTVIVTEVNGVETIREIRSNMEKNVRFSSGTRSKTPLINKMATAEDMRDRQFSDHLGRYYEGIVSLIKNADSIWIMGPGEAKVELENQLKRDEMGGRIVGIETVDKLTDRQIVAKVRQYFKY
jgi:hypothetical protein